MFREDADVWGPEMLKIGVLAKKHPCGNKLRPKSDALSASIGEDLRAALPLDFGPLSWHGAIRGPCRCQITFWATLAKLRPKSRRSRPSPARVELSQTRPNMSQICDQIRAKSRTFRADPGRIWPKSGPPRFGQICPENIMVSSPHARGRSGSERLLLPALLWTHLGARGRPSTCARLAEASAALSIARSLSLQTHAKTLHTSPGHDRGLRCSRSQKARSTLSSSTPRHLASTPGGATAIKFPLRTPSG